MPYIVAIQTKALGTESYIIEESLQDLPYGCMTKISKPHLKAVPLQVVHERLTELSSQKFIFYAFGAHAENKTFEVEILDLQQQAHWLVAKPEDHGVAHNAYDEVRFLFNMLLLEMDPKNLSWQDANTNPHLREIYDAQLSHYGYNPISRSGTSSSIHGSSDWTIPLRLKVSHERDILAMKGKLYIFCLIKGFSKAEYLQLESFAFINLEAEYREALLENDYSNYPLPQVGNREAFQSYYNNLQLVMSREVL